MRTPSSVYAGIQDNLGRPHSVQEHIKTPTTEDKADLAVWFLYLVYLLFQSGCCIWFGDGVCCWPVLRVSAVSRSGRKGIPAFSTAE